MSLYAITLLTLVVAAVTFQEVKESARDTFFQAIKLKLDERKTMYVAGSACAQRVSAYDLLADLMPLRETAEQLWSDGVSHLANLWTTMLVGVMVLYGALCWFIHRKFARLEAKLKKKIQ